MDERDKTTTLLAQSQEMSEILTNLRYRAQQKNYPERKLN